MVWVKNNLLKYFITQFWKLHVFFLILLHSRLQEIEDAYGEGFYMYIASEIHVNHVIEKLLLPSFKKKNPNYWKMSLITSTKAAVNEAAIFQA